MMANMNDLKENPDYDNKALQYRMELKRLIDNQKAFDYTIKNLSDIAFDILKGNAEEVLKRKEIKGFKLAESFVSAIRYGIEERRKGPQTEHSKELIKALRGYKTHIELSTEKDREDNAALAYIMGHTNDISDILEGKIKDDNIRKEKIETIRRGIKDSKMARMMMYATGYGVVTKLDSPPTEHSKELMRALKNYEIDTQESKTNIELSNAITDIELSNAITYVNDHINDIIDIAEGKIEDDNIRKEMIEIIKDKVKDFPVPLAFIYSITGDLVEQITAGKRNKQAMKEKLCGLEKNISDNIKSGKDE